MLRSFTGRLLLAAKTSVKEPVKAKSAVKAKEKKVIKVVDPTKFHHNKWRGNDIFQLVRALPKPKLPGFEHKETWLHKNGQGLKFYRPLWARYPEPCYWTIARLKPKHKLSAKYARVWGFLTWRGVTEPLPRPIPGRHRKEWRILLEPGTQLGPSAEECWTVPAITLDSDAKTYTQLPEDLPGVEAGTWPYPWGKLGSRSGFPREEPKPTNPILVKIAEEAEVDRMKREDAAGARANWIRDYEANLAARGNEERDELEDELEGELNDGLFDEDADRDLDLDDADKVDMDAADHARALNDEDDVNDDGEEEGEDGTDEYVDEDAEEEELLEEEEEAELEAQEITDEAELEVEGNRAAVEGDIEEGEVEGKVVLDDEEETTPGKTGAQ